jgi:hypothetical protein
MTRKNVFVGNDASFYQALLGRNVLGQAGSADLSAFAAQVIQLNEEVDGLRNAVGNLRKENKVFHDEVGNLRRENQRLMKQCDVLEARISAFEERLRSRR